MKTYIYGIVSDNLGHIDVSSTERGAKNYATRNGYNIVTRRDVNHYYIDVVAKHNGKKWVNEL